MLGKIEGRRRRGQQRMRWLDGISNSIDMSLCKLQRSLAFCGSLGRKELDTTKWPNNNNDRSRETVASPSMVSLLIQHLILFLLQSPCKETRKVIVNLMPQMGNLRLRERKVTCLVRNRPGQKQKTSSISDFSLLRISVLTVLPSQPQRTLKDIPTLGEGEVGEAWSDLNPREIDWVVTLNLCAPGL